MGNIFSNAQDPNRQYPPKSFKPVPVSITPEVVPSETEAEAVPQEANTTEANTTETSIATEAPVVSNPIKTVDEATDYIKEKLTYETRTEVRTQLERIQEKIVNDPTFITNCKMLNAGLASNFEDFKKRVEKEVKWVNKKPYTTKNTKPFVFKDAANTVHVLDTQLVYAVVMKNPDCELAYNNVEPLVEPLVEQSSIALDTPNVDNPVDTANVDQPNTPNVDNTPNVNNTPNVDPPNTPNVVKPLDTPADKMAPNAETNNIVAKPLDTPTKQVGGRRSKKTKIKKRKRQTCKRKTSRRKKKKRTHETRNTRS